LNASGDALVCSAHGAVFDATGFCLAGPCQGKALLPLELDVRPRASADTPPADQNANDGALTDKDIVLIGRLAHS
jgi:nitrite reductase/ring-hydroxylating ferredoxin subunit